MASAFGSIMSAEDKSRKGNRPRKGKYRLRITKMIERHGHKGHAFIVEARVISATKTDATEEPSSVGSSVSFVQMIGDSGDKGKMAKINAKEIVASIFGGLGYTPDKITEALYEQALAKGSMAGVDVEVESFDTTTRDGRAFVGFNFTRIEGQKVDDVKRQRAELGALPTPAAETAKAPAPTPKAAPPAQSVDDLLADL